MALQKYDELNSMAETWYSKMRIPEKRRKERVDLSLLFADIFVLFFDIIDDYKLRDLNDLEDFLVERLEIAASNFVGIDNLAYINDWSQEKAKKIVKITIQNIEDSTEEEYEPTPEGGIEAVPKMITFEEFGITMPQKEYWKSEERAEMLGIECASTIANFSELNESINEGMTNKVWITEGDDRVRPTHQEVDHVDKPIAEPFVVGSSYMLFPCDTSYNAEDKEICSCRCWCEYYKK